MSDEKTTLVQATGLDFVSDETLAEHTDQFNKDGTPTETAVIALKELARRSALDL
jgi:broad specificity polyphosphatase/5'/3'-nucleotidase SurE